MPRRQNGTLRLEHSSVEQLSQLFIKTVWEGRKRLGQSCYTGTPLAALICDVSGLRRRSCRFSAFRVRLFFQLVDSSRMTWIETVNEDNWDDQLAELRQRVADPATGTVDNIMACLLYTSPSPRDRTRSRMPSSA